MDFHNMSAILQQTPSPFVKRLPTKVDEALNEDEEDEEFKQDDDAHPNFRELHEKSFKS